MKISSNVIYIECYMECMTYCNVQYGYIDIFIYIYKQSIISIIVDKLLDMTQNIIIVFLVDFIIIDFVSSLVSVCALFCH